MIELTDLPETKEKIIRQNARWYQGVLDDVAYLWATWRDAPTAFNLAQLVRHVVNKVVEWPIAAFVYPAMGYLGWHFAYAYRQDQPLLFFVAVAVPTLSLGLTIWVGGVVTQREVQAMEPYLPRPTRLGWDELGRVAARHVPLPDLLAPGHARGVARPVADRPRRALRAEQDGPRDARERRGPAPLAWWERIVGGDRLGRVAGTATAPPAPGSASRPSRRARPS